MREQKINDATGKVILFLSVTALLTVFTGYLQPPQPDEGTGAHIFQLCIVALAPALCYLEHHRDYYYVGRARCDPAAGKSA